MHAETVGVQGEALFEVLCPPFSFSPLPLSRLPSPVNGSRKLTEVGGGRAKPQSLFAKTTAGRGLGMQTQTQQPQSMGGKEGGQVEGESLFGVVEGAKKA